MPRRTLPIVPDTAVGIIMSSDVPLATRSLVPNSSMSAGTTMIPPPTPMRPARMPVMTPSTTSPRDRQERQRQLGVTRRDDDEEAHDHGDEEADEAPSQQRSAALAGAARCRSARRRPRPPPGSARGSRRPSRAGHRRSHRRSRSGTIAASDVPAARRWSKPRISTSSGTITVPPPTPNRPESSPASRPMPRQVEDVLRAAGAHRFPARA